MSSDYHVKLEHFEGPLDLLLHLIRVHEIDVFDIDIYRLATEYLNYLRLIKFNDLADAGAFLEMAANLIEIKSRMLLPTDERKTTNEDGEEDDPIKTLQERLIQYERIRRAAAYLAALPQFGVQIKSSHEHERLAEVFKDVETPLTGDAATLVVLYEQMLRGLGERKNTKVEAKTHMVSLEDTIAKMQEYLDVAQYSLFQGFYNKFTSRYELVVHILAILELARQFRIKFYQQDFMGPLWIYRPDCDESMLPIGQVAIPDYQGDAIPSLTV